MFLGLSSSKPFHQLFIDTFHGGLTFFNGPDRDVIAQLEWWGVDIDNVVDFLRGALVRETVYILSQDIESASQAVRDRLSRLEGLLMDFLLLSERQLSFLLTYKEKKPRRCPMVHLMLQNDAPSSQ